MTHVEGTAQFAKSSLHIVIAVQNDDNWYIHQDMKIMPKSGKWQTSSRNVYIAEGYSGNVDPVIDALVATDLGLAHLKSLVHTFPRTPLCSLPNGVAVAASVKVKLVPTSQIIGAHVGCSDPPGCPCQDFFSMLQRTFNWLRGFAGVFALVKYILGLIG